MATWERREITSRRVEFHVPTNSPWGADWVQVQRAISAAISELRDRGLLAEDEQPSNDRIRLHGTDEAIVVSYEAVADVHS
jgi:hypothetical protein